MWKPIETAPKTRHILLNVVDLTLPMRGGKFGFTTAGKWHDGRLQSWNTLHGRIPSTGPKRPTHWDELPEPITTDLESCRAMVGFQTNES